MRDLLSDIRFAFRMLGRNAGITALAIMTLALGMGGNAVIFSIFSACFLRPLPFEEPGRLIDLNETAPRWGLEYTGLKYADFDAWRRENRSFEAMAAWTNTSGNISVAGNAERVDGARVTHELPQVLGLHPTLGRFFTAEEDRPGAARVAVIGIDLWQRLFGGKPDVLGQSIMLDGEPYTIIGVLPSVDAYMANGALWMPLAMNPDPGGAWFLGGVGRLKKGATLDLANQDLLRLHRSLVENKQANENTLPRLTPLSLRMLGDSPPVIVILMAATALLLLIACCNVASMTLARGLARSRELSIRMALGASPWRVGRMILTECLVFSTMAGLLGMLLGRWGLDALLLSLGNNNLPHWIRFTIDGRIWLYALAMVLFSSFSGALPVYWVVIRGSQAGALQTAARQSTATPGKHRGLNLLIVAETALTLVLLIQAGLLLQAFRAIQKMDPGYRPEHVLTYRISLPGAQYGSRESRLAFFRNHLEKVRALPGVAGAGAVDFPPLGGHRGSGFEIENAPPKGPKDMDPIALTRSVMPGYFEAMGIPIVAGRPFTEQDGANEGSRAIIVDEAYAKQTWPGQDPLGKRIRYSGNGSPRMTVIGVARDVRHYGLDQKGIAGVYLPFVQDVQGNMAVMVHTALDPLGMVAPIREFVRRGDPNLAVFDVAAMSVRLHESLWARRTYSNLLAIFAVAALLMAVGGIYGVFSYVVGRRTQEIGIRLALGARPSDVLWMVMRQGLALAGIGSVLGLVAAGATVPLMRSLLEAVSVSDLWSCVFVPFLLIGVAMLACWVPARRATKVDPMAALRTE